MCIKYSLLGVVERSVEHAVGTWTALEGVDGFRLFTSTATGSPRCVLPA